MNSRIFRKIKLNILLPEKECRGDILFWSAVFAMLQIAVRFVGGFFLGFESVRVSAAVVLSVFMITAFRELLRAALTRFFAVGKRQRLLICVVVALAFSAADLLISNVFRSASAELLIFRTAESVFGSLLLTALAYKGLFTAPFIFAFITRVLTSALPFAPAFSERLSMLMNTVLAMMFLIVLDCAFGKSEKLKHEREKPHTVKIALASAACAVFAAGLAFFCGLLPIHPISVATGSMQPDISVGDVLLVQKCSMEQIEIGDVIQFNHDGKTVMHRVVDTANVNGERRLITKGDANNANDAGSVGSSSLIGKVVGKIPFVGRLTLWLHTK